MKRLFFILITFIGSVFPSELCYKYSSGRIKFIRNTFDYYRNNLKGIHQKKGIFYVQREIPLSFKPPKEYFVPFEEKIITD